MGGDLGGWESKEEGAVPEIARAGLPEHKTPRQIFVDRVGPAWEAFKKQVGFDNAKMQIAYLREKLKEASGRVKKES